jgi:hypothetical protein
VDAADLRDVDRRAGPHAVGDFVQRTAGLGDRLGQPLTAATKDRTDQCDA